MICLKLQRSGTKHRLPNIKENFTKIFKQQMSVLHQSLYMSKYGLSSIKYAWEKHKDKVVYKSDCNQNYWQIIRSLNLSQQTEYKDMFIKSTEKLVLDELPR